MNQVDLHCHTTASDGVLDPGELVRRAARLALTVVAVTDHDTVAGVPAALAAGQAVGVTVIPGVEINTDIPGNEVHVLGYYLNYQDPRLEGELVRLREGRLARAQRIVDRLSELGAPVSLARVLRIAGDASVGRPHVAQALMEAGYVSSFGEAFDRYLGRHSPAYVERMKFTPAEACQSIRRAGGVPVLAHPVSGMQGQLKGMPPLEDLLPGLIEAGLLGIEVYYPSYDVVTTEHLLALARRYRLVPTGGTDFHGPAPERVDLGGIYVPMKTVRRLRAAWEQMQP